MSFIKIFEDFERKLAFYETNGRKMYWKQLAQRKYPEKSGICAANDTGEGGVTGWEMRETGEKANIGILRAYGG